jgi:hypothetical protein
VVWKACCDKAILTEPDSWKIRQNMYFPVANKQQNYIFWRIHACCFLMHSSVITGGRHGNQHHETAKTDS